MASLICNGDLERKERSLGNKIYVRPILRKHPEIKTEEVPQDVFFEDIIEKAVRRMFEETGSIKPVAPSIRVINLSVCHKSRWLYKIITPGGRLLDWLSWKYKVLFCVSSGNFLEAINIPENELSEEGLAMRTIQGIVADHRKRKLLMPADSINSITVGALHTDHVQNFNMGQRVDILSSDTPLPSPISSVGHGFSGAIKPEILFPGGRQLYNRDMDNKYVVSEFKSRPGQLVATSSPPELNKYTYTCGTSNANALASRSAGLISEMLNKNKFYIPDENQAVVLKALLVHGARWGEHAKLFKKYYSQTLDKRETSRYLGFGIPDIEKVMTCTEKRVTAIGFDQIGRKAKHLFELPLPTLLKGSKKRRILVITLAWLTPVDPFSPRYRVAKLEFTPPNLKQPLFVKREDVDSWQAKKGTVQHEVLSSTKEISDFTDNDKIAVTVQCTGDSLTNEVPYGLAVTLETEEDVNIYVEIKEKIQMGIMERISVST